MADTHLPSLEDFNQLRSELAQYRQLLSQAEADLASRDRELANIGVEMSDIAQASMELKMKLLNARDAVIGTAAELGTMRARHESARAEIDSLINQLNLVQSSRTWRIGRIMLLPLRAVRWVVRKLIS